MVGCAQILAIWKMLARETLEDPQFIMIPSGQNSKIFYSQYRTNRVNELRHGLTSAQKLRHKLSSAQVINFGTRNPLT